MHGAGCAYSLTIEAGANYLRRLTRGVVRPSRLA